MAVLFTNSLKLKPTLSPPWDIPSSPPKATPKRSLCAKCAAIPMEVFRPRPKSDRISAVMERYTPSLLNGELGSWSDISFGSQGVPDPGGLQSSMDTQSECGYQHYGGSKGLEALSRSSRNGCALCTILMFSLEALKQSLPETSMRSPHYLNQKVPLLPERLQEETGITLHSFDHSHFIVRDPLRWSFVRFLPGNRVNDKGWHELNNCVEWRRLTIFLGYLLHEHANDKGVFALVDNWLGNCTRSHHSCTIYQLNSTPGYVPARLIRIENCWPASPRIRARLCERIDYQYGEDYIALSHCWGSNPERVPRTTTANLHSRLIDIPWSDLTRTFQDAMEVTVYCPR